MEDSIKFSPLSVWKDANEFWQIQSADAFLSLERMQYSRIHQDQSICLCNHDSSTPTRVILGYQDDTGDHFTELFFCDGQCAKKMREHYECVQCKSPF